MSDLPLKTGDDSSGAPASSRIVQPKDDLVLVENMTKSFGEKVALEFGDRADDDDDGPAQRSAGVDIFPERDELDLEPGQLIQDFEVMFYRSRDPV